ncbi:MAG: LysE family translocator [Verrucomicrobiales bacterium]|jgi:threonine/homoserine/homoserine lactone efflux protein|nr:LysE family translocator [Verrucomicrobiales bacterium]
MWENSPITWTFIGMICVGIVSPGPDMLYILSLGIGRGRSVACAGAAGIAAGLAAHTTLGAAGLLALVRASRHGLAALKAAGAVYLFYLGVKTLTAKSGVLAVRAADGGMSRGRAFRDGFLINILNPKFVLFSLSFFPLFIRDDKGAAGWQMLQLGVCNMVFALVIFCVVGSFSALLDKVVYERPRVLRVINLALGLLFILLGAELFHWLFTGWNAGA